MAPKQISQQAFDDMVQENMDALGLEPEEALNATLEELQLEGIDVSSIVKCIPGSSDLDNHPLVISTKALKEKREERSLHLLAVEKALGAKSEDAQSDSIFAIALREGTLEALLENIGEEMSTIELKQTCRNVVLLLNGAPFMQSRFLEIQGAEKCMQLVKQLSQLDGQEFHKSMAAVMRVVAAACKKCEPAKCKFMDPECIDRVHAYLNALLTEGSTREASVKAILAFFMSLTNPDDPETSASQTFMHSRLLSQQKVHLTILKVLESETTNITEGVDTEIVIAALNAVRCLAANDEICKDFADAGGVVVCMKFFASMPSDTSLVKTTCNTFRQLSCSDVVKSQIMANDGAAVLSNLLSVYGTNGDLFEGLVGLMTLITLRQPQFAKAFCDAKCHEHIKDAFSTFDTQPKVLRQCCACIRNFVVRDETIKQSILALGVEPFIRKCKAQFPPICQEDASNALRDLGFDDYH